MLIIKVLKQSNINVSENRVSFTENMGVHDMETSYWINHWQNASVIKVDAEVPSTCCTHSCENRRIFAPPENDFPDVTGFVSTATNKKSRKKGKVNTHARWLL